MAGVIPISGNLQVTVDFHPLTVGEQSGEIVLHYDAGQYFLNDYFHYFPLCEINVMSYLTMPVVRSTSGSNSAQCGLQCEKFHATGVLHVYGPYINTWVPCKYGFHKMFCEFPAGIVKA